MTNPSAIEARLAEAGILLNGQRRRLIQTTLENPDETVFMSARALAHRNGVNPATVVRTVQALGYKHYSEFVADLREHFFARLSPYGRMQASSREKRSLGDHLGHSIDLDMDGLSRLKSGLDLKRVTNLAQRIHASRHILVVGSDMARSLASFLAYGLVTLGFKAETPEGSEGAVKHHVHLLNGSDLVIAVSFGRCLRVTVEAAALARRLGVPTFGITDSDTTPIARHCDAYLLASILCSNTVDSYVAPMALLNVILLACAQLKPKRSLRVLRESAEDYRAGSRWYEPMPPGAAGKAGQNSRRQSR